MNIDVTTNISAVTVYPDRARVTASGQADVSTGVQRLIIGNLPMALEPESVRVSGHGTARVRLLSVDVARAFFEEAPADQVQRLEDEIRQLEDEKRVLSDDQAILSGQSKYLEGLRAATEQYARGLSRGKTSVEDQNRLTEFLQEKDRQIRSASRELDKSQRELDRRLDKLRRELSQLQSARPRQRYEAYVDVEVLGDGTFSPEVTYVVGNAGWLPLYDLRLLEQEHGRKLEVTTIAQITQRTGQDWSSVDLSVSTARPALNQRMPELKPWYVDSYQPPIAQPRTRPAPAMVQAAAQAASDDVLVAGLATAEPDESEAEHAVAAVHDAGMVVSFTVPGNSDVPSDGSPHKTILSRFELDPELDFLAVPKHTDAVFRRVKAVNTGPGPMLAGAASLFVGEEYNGSTRLEHMPVGSELELLLGAEERITIDRELTRRDVDKVRLRDKRQLSFGYKIELHNLLSYPVQLELHDHIPVARHEEIRVKLESATPQPEEQSDLNLMEWHLSLPPGGKETVRYEFQVEHPRNLRIVGLTE